ncbi:uncharacterized protein [Haliotis cracherodii]|uniref:uncharacterized protein n=1 Tax=Haliotis cracherodii TaxID=6455 RepID=UPI0039EA0D03
MASTLHLLLTVATIVWGQHELPTYETHPCMRECVDGGTPMTCEYTFTLEYYIVLSKACFACPSNITDCYRPHCVAADGVRRPIITVNRMLPGPALHVCQHDTVVVNVDNRMEGSESTAIHFHGVFQKGSPHHDGVPMITQCPIESSSTFQYKFKADNRGSMYWHAHAGLQRADGVFGALIIREPAKGDPSSHLYQHDLPEHALVVHDWLTDMTMTRYTELAHVGVLTSKVTMLINGRGAYQDFIHPDTNQTVYTPYSVFRVRKDAKYRFRVISSSILKCPIQISVDDHDVTMIASDGVPFEPVVVSSFVVFPGERYDFILDADKAVGNYWIRARGMLDCAGDKAKQVAILRYDNANETEPSAPTDYESAVRGGKLLNPLNEKGSPDQMPVSWLNATLADPLNLKEKPDKKFYLAVDFNKIDNYRIHHELYYPISATEKDLPMPQANNISNKEPPAPLLTQYNDVPKELFCTPENTRNCSNRFCECINVMEVALDDTVEIILIDEGSFSSTNHPFHLHGYNFRVVAMDKINISTTLQEVMQLDTDGLISRNLETPVAKDTVTIPNGGYTVIRFKADNPGFWLFHCHVTFHSLLGMGVVIQTGDLADMPPAPKHFPRCGNWRYTGETNGDMMFCSSGHRLVSSWTVIILCILIWMKWSIHNSQ